nr:myosin-1 [Ipomoea batatas]
MLGVVSVFVAMLNACFGTDFDDLLVYRFITSSEAFLTEFGFREPDHIEEFGRREAVKRMTQRANGSLPSLQSIKSLPLDARFVQSGSLKKPDVVNQKGYRMASDMVADNGEFFAEVNGISNEDNDESPYRSFSFSANERPSAVDDDLNVTTYPSRSVAPTSAESKWSDTKFYAAKKVTS